MQQHTSKHYKNNAVGKNFNNKNVKIATTTATTSCNSSSTYHVAAINFTKFWFIAPTRRAPDASMVRSAASGICWHSFACALAVSFSSYCVSLSVSNVCFLYILFFYIFFFNTTCVFGGSTPAAAMQFVLRLVSREADVPQPIITCMWQQQATRIQQTLT